MADIRWDWIERNAEDIQRLSIEHLELVAASIAIAVVMAVPLGVLVRNRRLPYQVSVQAANVLYTIPSLALFGFLVPIVGIGAEPVIIGLSLYSLYILIVNTVVGLQSVPAAALEAARGMGMTRTQMLARVELPLALPSIVAGVRIATVTAVGIATIGAIVSGGGLGELIFTRGIQRGLFLTPIVVGAVCATAMAVVLDALLVGLQWLLTPWARSARRASA